MALSEAIGIGAGAASSARKGRGRLSDLDNAADDTFAIGAGDDLLIDDEFDNGTYGRHPFSETHKIGLFADAGDVVGTPFFKSSKLFASVSSRLMFACFSG